MWTKLLHRPVLKLIISTRKVAFYNKEVPCPYVRSMYDDYINSFRMESQWSEVVTLCSKGFQIHLSQQHIHYTVSMTLLYIELEHISQNMQTI